MLIKKPDDIPEREITPEKDYVSRRLIMKTGVLAASVMATAALYRALNPPPLITPQTPKLAGVFAPTTTPTTVPTPPEYTTDETLTTFENITNYNNFYEFDTGKREVAFAAQNFVSRPWTVEITGLCSKPTKFDLDDLLKLAPQESRTYRMRCVEGWSMVIPWVGMPLAAVLNAVEPLSSAKYVRFTTLLDPKRMPNQNSSDLDWPYVEGLRMDEAMHPLTILASGIYDRQMPPQNGAPIRLVVPWKYGFKGIKSIVKIELVKVEPVSTWTAANAREYGFYSNVNPNVRHPRWSQATEKRISGKGVEIGHPTLMFNGYGEQVANLYSGMDLKKYF